MLHFRITFSEQFLYYSLDKNKNKSNNIGVGGIPQGENMADCRTKEETEKIVKRLNRIEGQVKGIKNMVIEDRECMEILNQLLSVSSALRGVWEIMAAKHIEHCLDGASLKERHETIEDIIGHLHQLR